MRMALRTENGARVLWVVIGTRPEAIKVAPVVAELERAAPHVDVVVVHTGQHPPEAMAAVRRNLDLAVRADEDPELTVERVSLALYAALIEAFRRARGPDAVLVQGDTASALGAALGAKRAEVPVIHLEAGLRSEDPAEPWPEEPFRRRIGPIADLHLCPSARSLANLAEEWGLDPGRPDAYVVGQTGLDALRVLVESHVEEPKVVRTGRVLLTLHRREGREKLAEHVDAVVQAAFLWDYPVRILAHPSSHAALRAAVTDCGVLQEAVQFRPELAARFELLDPLSHEEIVRELLDRETAVVVTDSGGLQEECAALGVQCVVVRRASERAELEGPRVVRAWGREAVRKAVSDMIVFNPPPRPGERRMRPTAFGDGHASAQAVDRIVRWLGVGDLRG